MRTRFERQDNHSLAGFTGTATTASNGDSRAYMRARMYAIQHG